MRWLSPLPLWTGILAGPFALAADQLSSYALVKWACASGGQMVLSVIGFASLAVVVAAAATSWVALQHADPQRAAGDLEVQRARFMALLGLASSAFFALAIVAIAIPKWMLDACL